MHDQVPNIFFGLQYPLDNKPNNAVEATAKHVSGWDQTLCDQSHSIRSNQITLKRCICLDIEQQDISQTWGLSLSIFLQLECISS